MSTISKPQPRSVEKIPFHEVIEGGTYLYWIEKNKMFAEGKVTAKYKTGNPGTTPDYDFKIDGQTEPIYKVYKPLLIPIPYQSYMGYVKVLDPKEGETYFYVSSKEDEYGRFPYLKAILEKKLIQREGTDDVYDVVFKMNGVTVTDVYERIKKQKTKR